MNKLRRWLMDLVKPRDWIVLYAKEATAHDDEPYGRKYIDMGDGLRLYFEDNEYVGFSTQLPYIGEKEDSHECKTRKERQGLSEKRV